jgi:dynein heavy chain
MRSATNHRYDSAHGQLNESRLERLFLYCLTWSLGGLLSDKERPALDAELRTFASANMPPKCAHHTHV